MFAMHMFMQLDSIVVQHRMYCKHESYYRNHCPDRTCPGILGLPLMSEPLRSQTTRNRFDLLRFDPRVCFADSPRLDSLTFNDSTTARTEIYGSKQEKHGFPRIPTGSLFCSFRDRRTSTEASGNLGEKVI